MKFTHSKNCGWRLSPCDRRPEWRICGRFRKAKGATGSGAKQHCLYNSSGPGVEHAINWNSQGLQRCLRGRAHARGEIIPEWWAISSRNGGCRAAGGRDHVGNLGGFK